MASGANLSEPDVVGPEFSGQWIAWDDANLRIIAHGPSFEEVHRQTLAAGSIAPTFEFVPPADAAFVGGL